MIVPRFRLLFWVGIIFLPAAIMARLSPQSAMLLGGLVAAFSILALIDGFLAFGRMEGINVQLPDVLRLSRDRDGEIEIRIKNDRMKIRRLRIGLAFPRGIYTANQDILAELQGDSTVSSILWPLRGLKRGRYILEKCYMEVSSPLGFWAMQRAAPVHAEIRVYPNLYNERKHMAAFFLSRGHGGIHTQRQVGKGRDFEQLREYIPSDSFDDIHWKATAKRGHPITKVYQIERTQEVYIIIDTSRLSGRKVDSFHHGARPEGNGDDDFSTTILERFFASALIMGLVAEQQGDMYGVLTFNDSVRVFVRAKTGKAHYNACREALYTLHPKETTPDFTELFTFIGTHIRRRALLVFLTNLDDPALAESFLQSIDLVSRRHLVLVNMLQPEGAMQLFQSSSVESVDDIYRALGGHFLWTSLRETEKTLRRRGVGFSLLENEKLCAQLVSQYLSVKQRQIL